MAYKSSARLQQHFISRKLWCSLPLLACFKTFTLCPFVPKGTYCSHPPFDTYALPAQIASKDGYVSVVIFDENELGHAWDMDVDREGVFVLHALGHVGLLLDGHAHMSTVGLFAFWFSKPHRGK